MGKGRHVHTVISHTDHTRKIIVHSTAENVAEGHQQKDDGAEFNAENDADDRSDTCNIEQLDEYVFPVGKNDSVHAVRVSDSRSFSVIWTENALHEFSIGKIAPDQDGYADEECNHLNNL